MLNARRTVTTLNVGIRKKKCAIDSVYTYFVPDTKRKAMRTLFSSFSIPMLSRTHARRSGHGALLRRALPCSHYNTTCLLTLWLAVARAFTRLITYYLAAYACLHFATPTTTHAALHTYTATPPATFTPHTAAYLRYTTPATTLPPRNTCTRTRACYHCPGRFGWTDSFVRRT